MGRKMLILLLILVIGLIGGYVIYNQINSENSKHKEIVKIGAILPLTGDNANYGKELQSGMEIALNEIKNSNSKIDLQVIYEDDVTNPNVGTRVFKNLVEINKVPLVIGAMFSSVTEAIASDAERKKVVLLSPTSSSVKLSYAGDFIFRIYPSDTYDGMYIADYCFTNLKVKKAAIVYLQVSSTTAISEIFKKEFENKGGNIVYETGYKEGETNFRSVILKLKEIKPEIIFIPGYIKDMSLLLKQSKELGFNGQFVSISTFNDPKILSLTSGAAEGTIFSTPYYDPTSQDSLVKKFVKKYKDNYSTLPSIWAGYGYDVVKVAFEAIQNSDKTSSGIKMALYSIKNFKGVTGTISFDKNGDVNKKLRIMKVVNGKFTPID